MRIFIIGGTRFVGPPLVRELLESGHKVTLFNRGQAQSAMISGAQHIQGDRKDKNALGAAIAASKADIAIDMIPYTPDDSPNFMDACRGVVSRAIALSSIDVYLAYGRIHRTEPGPPIPTPLKEDSPLRETDEPEGSRYDKISVERSVMGDSTLSGTVLRLPAIYGPGDHLNRLMSYVKRMDDGRQHIILGKSMANWKFSRGYVDNIAHAVSLAVENEASAGRIYNVAEPIAMTETEFVSRIGRACGWDGDIIEIADEDLPEHLQYSVDFSQDWEVDTQRIRDELGYEEIVNLDEAYHLAVTWQRENAPEIEPKNYDYKAEDAALKLAI